MGQVSHFYNHLNSLDILEIMSYLTIVRDADQKFCIDQSPTSDHFQKVMGSPHLVKTSGQENAILKNNTSLRK